MILSRETNFIDIWPMNFFNFPSTLTSIDNCWLFLMQLACILHMVPGWKKATTVRVFMCIDGRSKDAAMIHRNWEQTLIQLRIEAKIHVVIWDEFSSSSLTPSSQSSFPGMESADSNEVTFDMTGEWDSHSASSGFHDTLRSTTERRNMNNVKDEASFLKNVNEMISEHSSSTAVTFLYLPTPPASGNNSKKSSQEKKAYLEKLDILTANLPPTLLVHGISPVTSTTL